jgi:glycosyltransferase involved in cell wall biosynthesis
MTVPAQPLVSVLTPVYNGEDFLADCIESVLKQTYQHYEYIIVNNRSTDRTLEIALDYAKKDARIRVLDNEQFVPVIANHNIAFRLISAEAKYCKVVSADDLLFPHAIARLVELAESNPSVGIVGSYQLSGDRVRWQGFRYPCAVYSGVEMCRRVFLGGDKTFGFGSPTSILYRADLVRSHFEFYRIRRRTRIRAHVSGPCVTPITALSTKCSRTKEPTRDTECYVCRDGSVFFSEPSRCHVLWTVVSQ